MSGLETSLAVTAGDGGGTGISWVEPRDVLTILQGTGQAPDRE